MYIDISDIPHGGLMITTEGEGKFILDFGGRDLFPYKGIKVDSMKLHLDDRGDEIWVAGGFILQTLGACDRCGTDIERMVDLTVEKMIRKQKRDGGGDRELRWGDMELSFLSENGIVLEDLVYEQLALNTQQQLLCSAECKGLCPLCGVDLNRLSCDCEKSVVDPRLEVLNKLVDNKER